MASEDAAGTAAVASELLLARYYNARGMIRVLSQNQQQKLPASLHEDTWLKLSDSLKRAWHASSGDPLQHLPEV